MMTIIEDGDEECDICDDIGNNHISWLHGPYGINNDNNSNTINNDDLDDNGNRILITATKSN